MKESPILFNGEMVRAILDGRKTQTRRLLKPQPIFTWIGENRYKWQCGNIEGSGSREAFVRRRECEPSVLGRPGDRLYVRETFKNIASGEVKNGYGEVRYGFAYQADNATVWQKQMTVIHDLSGQPPSGPMQFKARPWKPSIHMPRNAARIWLEITDVRVQELNDISEDDAAAEGLTKSSIDSFRHGLARYVAECAGTPNRPAAYAFRELWMSVYGVDSWDVNPWVWAITFKRVQL